MPAPSAKLLRAVAALALGALVPPPLAAQAPPPDAVEGKWWGEIGSERERVEAGIEFRRGAEGKLVLYYTLPVLNVYATEVPAPVVRDGDRVKVELSPYDLNRGRITYRFR